MRVNIDRKRWILVFVLALGFLLYIFELAFYLGKVNRRQSSKKDKLSYQTQFFHPYYYFFFPRRSEIIKDINQEGRVPWISTKGFGGGIDPGDVDHKRLAFLVGGATVFGSGVSHPNDSITAHLNNLQNEYFLLMREFLHGAHIKNY